MNLEKLLEGLFDFQRLEREPTLQAVIDGVEERRFSRELFPDELELISAAGDSALQKPDSGKGEKPPWLN